MLTRVLRFGTSIISPVFYGIQSFKARGKASFFSLSFDCDFDKDYTVIPKLLDTLSSFNIPCSFACIGSFIKKDPFVHRRILNEGHEIVNHSFSHPDSFHMLNDIKLKSEIKGMIDICKDKLDYFPIGFRVPHFGVSFTSRIYQILESIGCKYSSSILSSKSSFQPYRMGNLIEFPLLSCPIHFISVLDSWHLLKSKAHSQNNFFSLLKKAVELCKKNNFYFNIYLDPYLTAGLRDFDKFLEFSLSQSIRFMKYEDIVKKLNG